MRVLGVTSGLVGLVSNRCRARAVESETLVPPRGLGFRVYLEALLT